MPLEPHWETWLSPAKLNLFLHILGRRDDGYHELQTLFQLLDFGDRMGFQTAESGLLSLELGDDSSVHGMPMDDNLILRAARALRAHSGRADLGARIRISKHIPAGAGLGGGSSNAAITLLALNRLWQLHLNLETLRNLAVKLGADVPVFVAGHSAWAEGVGERLEPVSIDPAWYVILVPDCHVSTAAIFAAENLTRQSSAIKMADFLAGRSRNDCEAVTRELYPAVDAAISWLGQHGSARMTGTGAAVFASFTDEAQAESVRQQVPRQFRALLARGMDSLETGSIGDL